jgi:hypothetical protein
MSCPSVQVNEQAPGGQIQSRWPVTSVKCKRRKWDMDVGRPEAHRKSLDAVLQTWEMVAS